MSGEVVHHIVECFGLREPSRMVAEYLQKGVGFMVGPALKMYLAFGVLEKGEHVHGPVTDILELLKAFAHPVGLYIRRQPLENLDTRTFIEEKQVRGWVAVEIEQMLHFWKEVRIGDLQKITRLVWLQSMALQNTMQCRFAGRCADHAVVRPQMAFGPSQ